MDKTIGFGIMGCGSVSAAHARAINSLPDARIVACCDAVAERARSMAAQLHCEWHDDYARMLARDDIHVVAICTPSGLHADQGITAAEAGKHVIVEKPIGLSLKKIDRLIDTCRNNNLKLTCIFQYRFTKAGRLVKQAVDEGRFGQLVFAAADCKWFRAQSYYDSAAWRGTWALDGGVLCNQAIHYIDQLCWLAGDVDHVEFARVQTRARKMEAEDSALAVIQFKNRAWGVVQGSTAVYPGLPARVEICGTEGSAVMSDAALLQWKIEGEQEAPAVQSHAAGVSAAEPAIASLTGHDLQIADFVQAIREDREPYVKPEDARRTVALVRAIYEKALGYQPLPH